MGSPPPTNHSSSQKTRINVLSYGIKIWTHLSSVLSGITRVTDGRTDGQTEFSSLYRVCITCSAVKTQIQWEKLHIPVKATGYKWVFIHLCITGSSYVCPLGLRFCAPDLTGSNREWAQWWALVILRNKSMSASSAITSVVYSLLQQDAQLLQRDRAAGCVIVFAKSRTLELGANDLRTL